MDAYKILGEWKKGQYIGLIKDDKKVLITELSTNFGIMDFWNNWTAYGLPVIFSIFVADNKTFIESELIKGVPLS